jgi:arginine/lysine/ornithine decarboxylase
MKGKLLQERAPLFEELRRYAGQPLIPFHMPGHKAGRGLEADWAELGFPAHLDLTEIPAFHWASAWEEAEGLAAEFFGADQTFFLVQGASQGIIGSIPGVFSPGDTVLVGRNCHCSVIQGIILAGLNPIFIEAEFLPEFHIPVGINMDSLKRRVEKYPNCKGLIITNPGYQGVADRLQVFREIIGDRILMVDEAHGGHFGWMGFDGYNAGDIADIWVHGTHKMFGSLTQTGLLHIRKGRIDPGQVKSKLALITTTSPSYILLASLDSNRRWLALHGARMFAEKLPVVREFKDRLTRVEGLRVLSGNQLISPPKRVVDPWKISVHFQSIGWTGYQAETVLREKYRIQSEYADLSQVTFLVAPWQTETELGQLDQALREIVADAGRRHLPERTDILGILPGTIPPLMMSPRDAGLQAGELVSLHKAAGRISVAVIAAYPPGIPLIAPGELIRAAEIEYIQEVLAQKGWVNGVDRQGMVRVTL